MKTVTYPVVVNCQPSTGDFTGWYSVDQTPTPELGEGTNNGWSKECADIQELASALNEAVHSSSPMDTMDEDWITVAEDYGFPVRFWEDQKFVCAS
jgi:hypothetical protein